MVTDYLLLGLYFMGFVFSIFGFVFLNRLKHYEDERLENGLNALLFGVFSFSLFMLVKSGYYLYILFPDALEIIASYLVFLNSLSSLIFVPLMAVCFLVAMLLFNEV